MEPCSIAYSSSIFGRDTKERTPWALEWAFTTGGKSYSECNNLHINVFGSSPSLASLWKIAIGTQPRGDTLWNNSNLF